MLSNNAMNCLERYWAPHHRRYPWRRGSGSKLEILLRSPWQFLVLDIRSHGARTSVDIQKGEARGTGGSERCYTGDEVPSTSLLLFLSHLSSAGPQKAWSSCGSRAGQQSRTQALETSQPLLSSCFCPGQLGKILHFTKPQYSSALKQG